MSQWSPKSWVGLPIQQQPEYSNHAAVQRALEMVRSLPPLVHPGEVDRLRSRLAAAGRGEAFLLQGGDCAERFVDCSQKPVENKLKILLQMSVVLAWGARMPVIRVGRMAGQFAKPRSRPTEMIDGREVFTYRGDHVNGFDPAERVPDPRRLVQAWFRSSATLNYVRALLDGGFADLREADHWQLDFVRDGAQRAQYADMVARIMDAVDFMDAIGVDAQDALHSVDFYTSHEGLLLAYESANTALVGDDWYNLGAHMIWIGDRTRQLDGAHVEYFRGIKNPIGVKVGPTMQPLELVDLVQVLNPDNEAGRITLIGRFGNAKVAEHLPELVDVVLRNDLRVTWSHDPMHGNTRSTDSGLKTRDFDSILGELEQAFNVHADAGSILGGVHFEMTGDNVTECVGGSQGLTDADLTRSYETFCDPRLNYSQSLEVAFLVARLLADRSSR